MGLLMRIPHEAYEIHPPNDVTATASDSARILIVCETDSDAGQLITLLQNAGLESESADNMKAGCESARSGRFGVIFSTAFKGDGSWKRLIELADQYDLNFEIILLARTFELGQWAEAMQVGAFDVLDLVFDLPRVAEVAQRALGAAYLKRFRTRADAGESQDTAS
jgi:DNA-binding NtrC family response regulator